MDKDMQKLINSIQKQSSSKVKIIILSIISFILASIILALMIPSAKALMTAKGTISIIPFILLVAIWIYAFYTSIKKIFQNKLIQAYSLILAASALVIVLMLYYLKKLLEV